MAITYRSTKGVALTSNEVDENFQTLENATDSLQEQIDNLEITTDTTPTDGSTNPVQSNGVFDALATKLNLSGGTMSGSINMGGNNLTHVAMIFDQDNIAAFLKSGGYRTITGVDGEGIFYIGTLGQGVGIRSFGSTKRMYVVPQTGLADDIVVEGPSESGKLALTSDISPASTASTGTDIKFDIPRTYGVTTPETGNITLDSTGAKSGMVQLIRHNHSSEPTFGSEFKVIGGGYQTGVINYIYCEYVKSDEILVSICQEL